MSKRYHCYYTRLRAKPGLSVNNNDTYPMSAYNITGLSPIAFDHKQIIRDVYQQLLKYELDWDWTGSDLNFLWFLYDFTFVFIKFNHYNIIASRIQDGLIN